MRNSSFSNSWNAGCTLGTLFCRALQLSLCLQLLSSFGAGFDGEPIRKLRLTNKSGRLLLCSGRINHIGLPDSQVKAVDELSKQAFKEKQQLGLELQDVKKRMSEEPNDDVSKKRYSKLLRQDYALDAAYEDKLRQLLSEEEFLRFQSEILRTHGCRAMLEFRDVSEWLRLTQDQKEKVREIRATFERERRDLSAARASYPEDGGAYGAKHRELERVCEERAREVLNAEQRKLWLEAIATSDLP